MYEPTRLCRLCGYATFAWPAKLAVGFEKSGFGFNPAMTRLRRSSESRRPTAAQLVAAIALTIVGAAHAAAQFSPIVTGAGDNGGTHVKVFSSAGSALSSFIAYGPSVVQGVPVAAGDVNGDGTLDIVTGLTGGTQPNVKVFDSHSLATLGSFFAYSPAFTGGVYVAAGDLDGDGFADIVTGAGDGGNSQVNVFSGKTGLLVNSFFAYSGFAGGVRVAVGDVNHDGAPDIITAPGPAVSSSPNVKIFSGKDLAPIASFLAYGPTFASGVYVSAGDVNGDGFADIVTGAGSGGGTEVKVFSGLDGSVLRDFSAVGGFNGEIRVAAGDVNGDSRADIVTGVGPGTGTGPLVKVFSGADGSELESFLAYDRSFDGGVFVAAMPVPEPATWLLGVAGMAMFSIVGRHRRSTPQGK